MADKELHILITGESGKGRAFVIRQRTLRNAIVSGAVVAIILSLGTVLSIGFFSSNRTLKKEIASLNLGMQSSAKAVHSEPATTPTELSPDHNAKISLIEKYTHEIALLKKRQKNLLERSINRLDERSRMIESIMNTIGVEVKIDEDLKHSGGPFVSPDDASYGEKLLAHTDRYLKILDATPFGRPVTTKISSKYGHRYDPLNRKKAFHEGIDFRGRTGDKILATAHGTVKRSTYSKGWGHHIVITHRNGYETLFAHLSKRLVKRGDTIKRGQIIGRVGNTGRSTGSHLHYEIHLDGKPIDPMKFIKVANLSMKVKS